MTIAKLTRSEQAEIRKLLTDYDNARCALFDHLDNLANEWDEAISGMREGNAAEAATGRLDTLRSWAEEIPETPDFNLSELS
jgi:hypothetical protein